jgi:ethanolaminephosphotransferase
VYKYLLSPLSEFLVQMIPMYVAPNTITFAGHICIVILYFMSVGYCVDCEYPTWLVFTAGFLYFMWLILDNIDGKQARRTKSSSPLGLMFDH